METNWYNVGEDVGWIFQGENERKRQALCDGSTLPIPDPHSVTKERGKPKRPYTERDYWRNKHYIKLLMEHLMLW